MSEVSPEVAQVSDWIAGVVLKRIDEDALVLPSLPSVTMACVELFRKDENNFKSLALTLGKEPSLVAQALRAATKAAAGAPIKLELAEILQKLGPKGVRALIFEAASHKVVFSKDKEIAAQAQKIWEHSVAVATLARDLAALAGSTASEAAYLGGLLHDLGKPVVATMLLEAERQVVEFRSGKWIAPSVWAGAVDRVQRKVGGTLAEKWKLPQEIVRCIRDCSEYDNADRGSIVNAVCLANAIAKLHGCAAGPTDPDDLGALIMIGRSLLGISDSVLKKLALELPERVAGLFS